MCTAQSDSLWGVWNDRSRPDSARLKAMQVLAWKTVFEQPDSGMALAVRQLELAQRARAPLSEFEAYTTMAVGSSMKSDYTASLGYLQRCLTTAQDLHDRKREANTYSNLSNVYKNLGDLPKALQQLDHSLRIDVELGNKEGLAGTYNNIGNIHTELGDLGKALENYQRSAALSEELDNAKGRAQALLNLGATHLELGALDTALAEFEQSLTLYRIMGRKLEMGMAFNNLGRVHARLDHMPEAFACLDSAEALLSAIGSMRHLARTHVNRGNLFRQLGNARKAIAACTEGERIATANGLLQQQRECLQCLMQAHELAGDYRTAYREQSRYMTVNDSLLGLNNSREVTRLEVTRTFRERMLADSLDNVRQRFEQEIAYQEQLGSERDRRNLFLIASIAVLAVAGGLWARLRFVRRSRAAIQREKDRSDDLLHNILPVEVATELKDKGHADAKHFDQVTILFTDFKGFTEVSQLLSPAELVDELNVCFKAFDKIMGEHGIEKIKTIGDAYMAAGGVPQARAGSVRDSVRAGLAMQEFMEERARAREAEGKPAFRMRVGLHTGPVVAGIVGDRKFQYDIWGDAVNLASRMESSGEVGEVNISAATHELLKDDADLTFTARGKVLAKGKGELEMYFVARR
ncbi:MAG: tetratricopeptide repeat protein [Flavobacteriales bacterium]|nr:tetratricopeptide repeat protein [Flavobacteriales bacterium]